MLENSRYIKGLVFERTIFTCTSRGSICNVQLRLGTSEIGCAFSVPSELFRLIYSSIERHKLRLLISTTAKPE